MEGHSLNLDELEKTKLEREIALLDGQLRSNKYKELRNWITLISIFIGIAVSTISAYEVLSGIKHKNKQLAMESILRSHDIFINQILDRVSAVKSLNYEINDKGKMILKSRNLFDTTTQRGATVAAVGLAREFKYLREPARLVIESQLATASSDPKWEDDANYLKRLLEQLNNLPE